MAQEMVEQRPTGVQVQEALTRAARKPAQTGTAAPRWDWRRQRR